MIEKKEYLVFAFSAPTTAFAVEKLKREDNLEGRLIPLPKEIEVGCGVAFASEKLDEKYWISYFKEHKIEYEIMKKIKL